MTETLERVKTYQQFIGGDFVDAADGRTVEVLNPAMKQSGWGKDGSKYALEDYTFIKHVMINVGE